MKKMLFSINSWIFGTAEIEEIAKRANEIGVDGLDISGEPDTTDIKRVKKALDKYNLTPFVINGNFNSEERALCHNNQNYRNMAIVYFK